MARLGGRFADHSAQTLQESHNSFRRTRAFGHPETGLVHVDLHSGWLGQRIVIAQVIHECAIAAGSSLGNDYTIARLLLRARAPQPNGGTGNR